MKASGMGESVLGMNAEAFVPVPSDHGEPVARFETDIRDTTQQVKRILCTLREP